MTLTLVLVLCLILVHQGLCQNSPGERIQCLSCERVSKPEDCLRRLRCAPGESCFTERYVTNEGHVFYDMGCKLQTTCARGGYEVSKTELKQRAHAASTSPHAVGKRQEIEGENLAAHVCEECCSFDHCNDLLCGGHATTGIKCLNCPDMQDMANCEKVRGCPGHEMCYLQQRITDTFELRYTAGCMREIQCQAYKIQQQTGGGGIFDLCFNCCNETFCNVQCAGDQTTTASPGPAGTTSAPNLQTTPPMAPTTRSHKTPGIAGRAIRH